MHSSVPPPFRHARHTMLAGLSGRTPFRGSVGNDSLLDRWNSCCEIMHLQGGRLCVGPETAVVTSKVFPYIWQPPGVACQQLATPAAASGECLAAFGAADETQTFNARTASSEIE